MTLSAKIIDKVSISVLVVFVFKPLPFFSELSSFRTVGTVGLLVYFCLFGAIPFRALCPLGLSAFRAL